MEEENRNNTLMQKMEEEAPDPSEEETSILDKSYPKEEPLIERTQDTKRGKEKFDVPSRMTNEPIRIDYSQNNLDEIEELIESVVDEKWRTLIENVGDIGLWKDKVRTEILSIKQEIVRLENRFDNLQKAILGKITTYDENIIEVGSEIKALEKVFSKIIDPLTTNIRELDRITKQLKEKN